MSMRTPRFLGTCLITASICVLIIAACGSHLFVKSTSAECGTVPLGRRFTYSVLAASGNVNFWPVNLDNGSSYNVDRGAKFQLEVIECHANGSGTYMMQFSQTDFQTTVFDWERLDTFVVNPSADCWSEAAVDNCVTLVQQVWPGILDASLEFTADEENGQLVFVVESAQSDHRIERKYDSETGMLVKWSYSYNNTRFVLGRSEGCLGISEPWQWATLAIGVLTISVVAYVLVRLAKGNRFGNSE